MISNCRIVIMATDPAWDARCFSARPDSVTVLVSLAGFLSQYWISFEIYKELPLFSILVTESLGAGGVIGEYTGLGSPGL